MDESKIDNEEPLERDAAATKPREGNTNAEFWDRSDVREAQKAIDLWASQRKHMEEDCEGVIRADVVFEVPRQTFEVFERGMRWVYEDMTRSQTGVTIRVKDLPRTLIATLFVNAVLVRLDLSPDREKGVIGLTEALLLHLYPRTGPYSVDAGHTHKSFNPRGFVGAIGGKYFDRTKERFLRHLERDFLRNLIEAGRSPSRFFGLPIEGRPDPSPAYLPYSVPTDRELQDAKEASGSNCDRARNKSRR